MKDLVIIDLILMKDDCVYSIDLKIKLLEL